MTVSSVIHVHADPGDVDVEQGGTYRALRIGSALGERSACVLVFLTAELRDSLVAALGAVSFDGSA